MNDKNSLAHTKWNCKYHIVFAPKYRRKLIYGELKGEIGKTLRELCKWKEVTIVEAEHCDEKAVRQSIHAVLKKIKFFLNAHPNLAKKAALRNRRLHKPLLHLDKYRLYCRSHRNNRVQ